MGAENHLSSNFPKSIEPRVSFCPGRCHTNSKPKPHRGRIPSFGGVCQNRLIARFLAARSWGYELEESNPMGAENNVLVKFLEIGPTAAFGLPRPWGYDIEASNPIGAENHVVVEFSKMDPTVGFWLSRPWGYDFQGRIPIGKMGKSQYCRISRKRTNSRFLAALAVGIRIRNQQPHRNENHVLDEFAQMTQPPISGYP